MSYTTQMDAARKGIFTEEMQRVCEYENIRKEELMDLVAKGQVAIPANKIINASNHLVSEAN